MMRWIRTASIGGDAMAPVKTENLTLDMWNVRRIEHPLHETFGGLSIKRRVEVHSQKWRSQKTSPRIPRRKLNQQNFQILSQLTKVFKITLFFPFPICFYPNGFFNKYRSATTRTLFRYYCYLAKNRAHFIGAFLGSLTWLFATGFFRCPIFTRQIFWVKYIKY